MLSAFLDEPRIGRELQLGVGRTVRTLAVDAQCTRSRVSPSASHRALIQPTGLGVRLPASLFCRVRATLCSPRRPGPTLARHGRTKPHAHRDRAKETSCTECVPSVTCVPSVCAQCMCPVSVPSVAVVRVLSVPSAQVTSRCARAGHGNGRSDLSRCPAVSFPPAPSVSIHPTLSTRQLFQISSHRILNLNIAIALASPSSSSCRPPPPPTAHRPSVAPPPSSSPHLRPPQYPFFSSRPQTVV